MARIALLLSVLVAVAHTTLAGPACAKKHYRADNCIQLCKDRWGWTGTMMGTNPWSSVMLNTDISPEDVLASACGMPTQVASTSAPESTTAVSTSSASASSITTTATPSTTTVSSTSLSTRTSTQSLSSFSTPSFSSSFSSSAEPTSTFAFVALPSVTTSSETAPTETPVPDPAPTTSQEAPSPTSSQETPAPSPSSSDSTTQSFSQPSSSSSDSTQSSGSTSDSDIQAYLSAHNSVRQQHGASDLTWSDNLASKAQQWAQGCVFQHSGGSLGPFGENLAAGTGSSYGIATAVNSWAVEVSQYNPQNPQASHFTQMVWKATTQVGCALQQPCSGIFDASFGAAKFVVCEYSPAGNIEGEFQQNVQV